jgi:LacI family transcriptional regulator
MARIRDIAERAGVSSTTVSHVLNGSRPVHPDTVARVRQAVEELHYTPNMLARSLRRRQTNTIGLLISDIENPYFAEVAYTVEKVAYERGYNLVLCNTDESHEKEARYVEVLFAKQVDGLIIAPSAGDHSYLAPYLARGERVVLVNRYVADIPAPMVIADDEAAMYALIRLFLDAGHRRLGAILGLETASTTRERIHALQRAVIEYGLSMDDVWQFRGQSRQPGGFAAAQAFIALPPAQRPTCVIAFNAIMHDGFLLGLADLAPALLTEVETGASGASSLAHLCPGARYFVQAPSHQIGRTATHLLLDILSGVTAWHTERIIVPCTLVDLKHRPG